jgi:hypothetical protein
MNNKRGFNGRCLVLVLLVLVGVFLFLNFFGVVSMNSLPIIVKDSEPARKPLALLFIGIVLLAFVIICVITGKHQKR